MAAPQGRFFPVQGLSLGIATSYRAVNVQYLGNAGDGNSNSGPFFGSLGQIVEDGGKVWRLVKFDNGTGNVAAIDGCPLYWKDKSAFTVTSDASDSECLANGIAGGCHVVATDLYYIFIQVGGDQAAVQVAASAVAGDHLTGHASTDLILTRTAAGTAPIDKLAATAMTTRGTTTTDSGASLANSSKVRWELGALLA